MDSSPAVFMCFEQKMSRFMSGIVALTVPNSKDSLSANSKSRPAQLKTKPSLCTLFDEEMDYAFKLYLDDLDATYRQGV